MSQIERHGIQELEKLLKELYCKKWMLVCDSSYEFLSINKAIDDIQIPRIIFSDFSSNPLHDDADKGTKLFLDEQCDGIVAVGGGSSMDVAKCIKLDSGKNVPLIAIPTTAGTGSESTRHIVVYRDGKKESLGNPKTVPNYIVFEPKVLKSLPLFQKKSTLLDALCQAIESWWNVNRTEESIGYSKEAISLIVNNMDLYIDYNDDVAAEKIMRASNLAGKAINITATTAAHAMSYKITSMFGIPHGNAVAICFPEVWSSMLDTNDVALKTIFDEIAKCLGKKTPIEAIVWFKDLLKEWEMKYPYSSNWNEDIETLSKSVNPVRLKNNPVQFTNDTIRDMYKRIVKK